MGAITNSNHLWAIVFEDIDRAEQVRDEVARLGWDEHYLNLLDLVVVVRRPDGSFLVNRIPFPTKLNIVGCTTAGFLAGLVLAAPLSGAIVGAFVGGAGAAVASQVGIDAEFIRDAETLMKPGASALFVLDAEG